MHVQFGKTSVFFSSGIAEDAWNCFTVVAKDNNKTKEFNFVSENQDDLATAVTVIDALGGASDDQSRITKARFLWMRAYMLASANQNQLGTLLAQGLANDSGEE